MGLAWARRIMVGCCCFLCVAYYGPYYGGYFWVANKFFRHGRGPGRFFFGLYEPGQHKYAKVARPKCVIQKCKTGLYMKTG